MKRFIKMIPVNPNPKVRLERKCRDKKLIKFLIFAILYILLGYLQIYLDK
jgi:hypothetical protein